MTDKSQESNLLKEQENKGSQNPKKLGEKPDTVKSETGTTSIPTSNGSVPIKYTFIGILLVILSLLTVGVNAQNMTGSSSSGGPPDNSSGSSSSSSSAGSNGTGETEPPDIDGLCYCNTSLCYVNCGAKFLGTDNSSYSPYTLYDHPVTHSKTHLDPSLFTPVPCLELVLKNLFMPTKLFNGMLCVVVKNVLTCSRVYKHSTVIKAKPFCFLQSVETAASKHLLETSVGKLNPFYKPTPTVFVRYMSNSTLYIHDNNTFSSKTHHSLEGEYHLEYKNKKLKSEKNMCHGPSPLSLKMQHMQYHASGLCEEVGRFSASPLGKSPTSFENSTVNCSSDSTTECRIFEGTNLMIALDVFGLLYLIDWLFKFVLFFLSLYNQESDDKTMCASFKYFVSFLFILIWSGLGPLLSFSSFVGYFAFKHDLAFLKRFKTQFGIDSNINTYFLMVLVVPLLTASFVSADDCINLGEKPNVDSEILIPPGTTCGSFTSGGFKVNFDVDMTPLPLKVSGYDTPINTKLLISMGKQTSSRLYSGIDFKNLDFVSPCEDYTYQILEGGFTRSSSVKNCYSLANTFSSTFGCDFDEISIKGVKHKKVAPVHTGKCGTSEDIQISACLIIESGTKPKFISVLFPNPNALNRIPVNFRAEYEGIIVKNPTFTTSDRTWSDRFKFLVVNDGSVFGSQDGEFEPQGEGASTNKDGALQYPLGSYNREDPPTNIYPENRIFDSIDQFCQLDTVSTSYQIPNFRPFSIERTSPVFSKVTLFIPEISSLTLVKIDEASFEPGTLNIISRELYTQETKSSFSSVSFDSLKTKFGPNSQTPFNHLHYLPRSDTMDHTEVNDKLVRRQESEGPPPSTDSQEDVGFVLTSVIGDLGSGEYDYYTNSRNAVLYKELEEDYALFSYFSLDVNRDLVTFDSVHQYNSRSGGAFEDTYWGHVFIYNLHTNLRSNPDSMSQTGVTLLIPPSFADVISAQADLATSSKRSGNPFAGWGVEPRAECTGDYIRVGTRKGSYTFVEVHCLRGTGEVVTVKFGNDNVTRACDFSFGYYGNETPFGCNFAEKKSSFVDKPIVQKIINQTDFFSNSTENSTAPNITVLHLTSSGGFSFGLFIGSLFVGLLSALSLVTGGVVALLGGPLSLLGNSAGCCTSFRSFLVLTAGFGLIYVYYKFCHSDEQVLHLKDDRGDHEMERETVEEEVPDSLPSTPRVNPLSARDQETISIHTEVSPPEEKLTPANPEKFNSVKRWVA